MLTDCPPARFCGKGEALGSNAVQRARVSILLCFLLFCVTTLLHSANGKLKNR